MLRILTRNGGGDGLQKAKSLAQEEVNPPHPPFWGMGEGGGDRSHGREWGGEKNESEVAVYSHGRGGAKKNLNLRFSVFSLSVLSTLRGLC